ncbi:MAG: sigma-70 family RNA polymerase sigma factor, partial [Clostridiales bacterium]|nr:sigma-70 family RNA polymerase sigma factor [Clostridiales bacterium]
MSDFEVIVNKYEKLVYTVCYRITANHSDALDATQEVFLQAYRHMGIWENDKALTGWLCRVANNKSIDLIRKRKPELSIDEQNDDESPNFQFQSDELTPERALTEAETRKELTEAINALPQEQ